MRRHQLLSKETKLLLSLDRLISRQITELFLNRVHQKSVQRSQFIFCSFAGKKINKTNS